MKEMKVNLFTIDSVGGVPVVAVCFTSNFTVRKDGKAVMGAGVAKVFKEAFEGLDVMFGDIIKHNTDNVTRDLGDWQLDNRKVRVIAYPTKNHWSEYSNLELIQKSAKGLKHLVEGDPSLQEGVILLPRPGCHHGGLKWEDVKQVIEPILPQNVVVVSN